MSAYVLLLPAFGCVFLAICLVAYVLTRQPERQDMAPALFSGALGAVAGLLAANLIFWIVVGVGTGISALAVRWFPGLETWLHRGLGLNILVFLQFTSGATGVWLASVLGAAAGFRIAAAQAPQPRREPQATPAAPEPPVPEPRSAAGHGRRPAPLPLPTPIPVAELSELVSRAKETRAAEPGTKDPDGEPVAVGSSIDPPA